MQMQLLVLPQSVTENTSNTKKLRLRQKFLEVEDTSAAVM